ncbi:G-type lectin S-receptor-like serine/threonine-protein kinase At2g19130 [Typha latifolia]|uniref:G-type lectin S-receptor-like serine/threonine-protein kinase At2g19130 n=1 Tax=Typha latifolia TaxID=4733 RepID=UPI003C2E1B00
MDTKSRLCSSLLVPFFVLFTLNTKLSLAADSISLNQSLSGNQTIVSKDGRFELGFFTPGNSKNYYIGIWYKKIPGQTVVWVANRRTPVSSSSSAELKIADGNLVLLNSSKFPVWSSNSTRSSSDATAAVLLDTGNLILTNSSSATIWQSFNHPTNIWMPGGWLGVNKITKEYQSITSWENPENPAPGPFTESMDPDGSNQYVVMWNWSQIYWSSGLWNGQYFSAVPSTAQKTVFNFTFSDTKERKFAMYTITDPSVITHCVVDSTGQLKQQLWINTSQQWQTVFTQPLLHCDVYSLCGPFGVCDEQSSSTCRCSDGFKPASVEEWGLDDWNSGCVRKTQLQCGNKSLSGGKGDGFLDMANVRLPSNPQTLMVGSAKECESACLSNCSCNAYSFDGNCSIWIGDLRNMQQLSDGDNGGGTVYLRLAASDLPHSSSSHKLALKIGLSVAAAAILVFLSVISALIWARCRRIEAQRANKIEGSLITFTYSDLQRITKNFSDKIGGGGFGPVFKGTLHDSTVVAVKKLEGFRQGEKQFRTEVSTLGAIHHVNLVRLCGFCSEGSRRLLVYEYMPGGSLDSHLFAKDLPILDWKIRYQIILGVARGLAYLHEKCRERIIHCDIKPGNILVDAGFCAKIADFGMAKLIGRDFSRVLTTMRGTIGYLAPEWISGLPITPKVDVYSFGMTLFEIVSGRRNADGGGSSFFPSWAAMQVVGNNILGLLDQKLEGVVETEQLTRVCRVACWCIQDSEAHRPTMGQVVQILEGVLEVNIPPIPRTLQQLTENQVYPMYQSTSIEDQGPSERSQSGEE